MAILAVHCFLDQSIWVERATLKVGNTFCKHRHKDPEEEMLLFTHSPHAHKSIYPAAAASSTDIRANFFGLCM